MTIERASTAKVPAAKAWPVIAAIALNLVPIVGVVFWGWSAFALIFLYWMENVVIGARTLISMLISGLVGTGPRAAKVGGLPGTLFICAFFTVHYGIFCLGHGSFVVGMFGDHDTGVGDLGVVGAAASLFSELPNLKYGLASIVLWQIVVLILFVVRGEAAKTDPLSLMASPYPRIIVLHVAIIFGGFLLMMFNEPLAGLVMLALVKTAFDVAETLGAGPTAFIGRRLERAGEAARRRDNA